MTTQLDKRTNELKTELLVLIDEVIKIYRSLYECLDDKDDECLKNVIKDDKLINAKELSFNEVLVDYVVSFSPVATDLREVISYLKIANDLERIADYTTNIAKIFRRGVSFNIYEMKKIKYGINLVIEFLGEIKELTNEFSSSTAYALVENDKELNELYRNYYSEQIVNYNKRTDIEVVVSTVSVLKYLERGGDHIVNIIEHMIYAEDGNYVRL